MSPSEGKDTDSSDSRKTLFLFFDFSVEFFGFLFLFPFIPLSIVVVDFLGTMKSVSLLGFFRPSVTFFIF